MDKKMDKMTLKLSKMLMRSFKFTIISLHEMVKVNSYNRTESTVKCKCSLLGMSVFCESTWKARCITSKYFLYLTLQEKNKEMKFENHIISKSINHSLVTCLNNGTIFLRTSIEGDFNN